MQENKKQQPHLPGTDIPLPLDIASLSYQGRTEYADPSTGIEIHYDDGHRCHANICEYAGADDTPDILPHYFSCVNEILDSEDEYRYFVKLLNLQILKYDQHQFYISWFFVQNQPDQEYQFHVLALTKLDGQYLKVRYSINLPQIRRALNVALLRDLALGFLDELVEAL